MANDTSLIALLRTIDANPQHDGILLSDGATDWSVDNLIDVLMDADEPDTAEYVQGEMEDGRLTITRLDADGYLESVPAYVQTQAD